jgi:hypothetical protein
MSKNRRFLSIAALCVLISVTGARLVQAAGAPAININSASNYNIFFQSAASGDGIGALYTHVIDLNNNGKNDLVMGSAYSDNNSRSNSGSVYIVYDSILDDFSGIGNASSMAVPGNYNIRIDGASANDFLGFTGTAADIDNDGKNDLIVNAFNAGNNGRSSSGSVYIIPGSILETYTGTGNVINLANSSSYSIRLDGAAADHYFGWSVLKTADLNVDGKQDLIVGTRWSAYNGRANSGALYIMYNGLLANYTGTGNSIDMASTTSFNIRYDGGASTEMLGYNIPKPVDVDGNNVPDLVIGAYGRDTSVADAGMFYVIFDSLFSAYGTTATGNIVDLATPGNFNIRFDGEVWHGLLAQEIEVADFTGDGAADIVVSAPDADNGMSTDHGKGWVYFLYNDLLMSYAGTGNIQPMASSTAYNLRLAGNVSRNQIGMSLASADMNQDGKNDLFMGAYGAEYAGADFTAGAIYLVYNELFSSYTSLGNQATLTGSTTYSVRYDGGAPNLYLWTTSEEISDINNDGRPDLVTWDWSSDGAVRVLLNFPHGITLDPVFTDAGTAAFTATGRVEASDNITNIAGVQWGHEQSFGDSSGAFLKTWHDCAASDGAFDSNSEAFTCSHEALDTDANNASPHTAYFRAKDSNGLYTAVSSYAAAVFTHASAISGVTVSQNSASTAVSWTTQAAATSTLEWGTSASYGMSTSTAATTTSHSFTIPTAACTAYYYRLTSHDIGGNSQSSTGTFTPSGCGEGSPSFPPGNGPIFPNGIPLYQPEFASATPVAIPSGAVSASSTTQPVSCAPFLVDLKRGKRGPEVAKLQAFLRKIDLFSYPTNTGYFGLLTEEAVKRFQTLHASQILQPLGLSNPTGLWYERTRRVGNAVCEI